MKFATRRIATDVGKRQEVNSGTYVIQSTFEDQISDPRFRSWVLSIGLWSCQTVFARLSKFETNTLYTLDYFQIKIYRKGHARN